MTKILIIRFSSIGDIIQNMNVLGGLKKRFPDAEIHWITRKDMASFLAMDKRIDKVWAFDKNSGFKGLVKMGLELRAQKFDYVYDAHCNIRSAILNQIITPTLPYASRFAQRGKDRWKRFLLFNFRINKFPKPFKGAVSFQEPLNKWGVTDFVDNYKDWHFPTEYGDKWKNIINKTTITLVPSANWEMKRWPIEHWQQLIKLLPHNNFIILAGPSDTFCDEIAAAAPDRVTNLAGKSNLLESCYLVHQSNFVVSGDTGFLHAADLFNIPTVSIMGPTAFGYPNKSTSVNFETPLPCRPCTKDGRGKCSQQIYKRCLVEVTPQSVANHIMKTI
ncbi:MAG: glycosyltransferase family 9 protein [Marinifilaceae bacterium]